MKVHWPRGAKLSKALARVKDYRPVLSQVWVRRKDEHTAEFMATNSFVMAVVPVSINPSDEVPEVPVPISRRAVAEAEAGARARGGSYLPFEVQVDDETGVVRMEDRDGVEITFGKHLRDGTAPEWWTMFPDDGEDEFTFAFNPKLLVDLAEAIGADPARGVKLTVRPGHPLRPIKVEPYGGMGAKGLLMPVRIP